MTRTQLTDIELFEISLALMDKERQLEEEKADYEKTRGLFKNFKELIDNVNIQIERTKELEEKIEKIRKEMRKK